MTWAAIIIVGGQACVMFALLGFVRTFGRYTDALMKAHNSNMLVYRLANTILEYAQETLRQENAQ